MYDSLQPYSTNSLLLVGHADGIALNDVIRINSVQEAVNLLSGDRRSPLLKGIFEAYNSGARDIFICAAAPMSEYIDHTGDRIGTKAYLSSSSATPTNLNFYQKYYERLQETYQVAKNYEFIDIIVPLEASIMNTGNVDFITQLVSYCNEFHNESGFVQIGVIGSRSNGVKDSDIAILESNTIFKNKYTTVSLDGRITSDLGRFVIPIYGEINFDHTGFPVSYAGTAAAAFAGTLSNTPVYNGMIRKRVNSAYSLYGANLSGESLSRLDNLGINTVYRSRKANRGNPYEIYISNDYTLANKNSIFSKTPQIRLAAMVINEIKSIGYQSVGKFSNDKIISNVKSMLESILKAKAIRDYNFDAYADRFEKGVLVFDISLVSSLSLKNIKLYSKYPCITYGLDLKKAHTSEPKPRTRQVLNDINQHVYGQRFQNIVAFTVITRADAGSIEATVGTDDHTTELRYIGAEIADRIMEVFEDFMLEYTPVFKRLGASEFVYARRYSDSEINRDETDVNKRVVTYMLTTEKLLATTHEKIESIVIDIRNYYAYEREIIEQANAATPNFEGTEINIIDLFQTATPNQ